MSSRQFFRLDFLLVDDDPSLNSLLRAALGTRKLRRLYESAIKGHYGGLVEVRAAIHFANGAQAARETWADLTAEYEQVGMPSAAGEDDGELVGYCTIALLDFDMPGENGLQLADSLKDEPVEMMLFTGRQPQMQAFLGESGRDLEGFGVQMAMLKGAPAQELNNGILSLLRHRLQELGT